jgi:ABC-type spermidine/putrescine transport system permease subunit I
VVLFLVPFYVVLAIAFGSIDPLFRTAVPVWNPARWNPANFQTVLGNLFGSTGFLGPAVLRTLAYVAVASVLCLLIGYPVAYFVARHGGRRRVLFLVLLLSPFWISFMMRLLAWVNLLGGDGLVNRALRLLRLVDQPVAWLEGRPVTVVLGLVYGYIPFMILPLFASLDRIDPSLLEAARDLGAGRATTFRRITLPLSVPGILAGLVIVTLPMFGDFFTNDLLSGSPRTAMIGNVINDAIATPGRQSQGAALVLVLLLFLAVPMLWYVARTAREQAG